MSEATRTPDDEQFVLEFRRHAYVLTVPTVVLGICTGVGAFLIATVPDSGARTVLRVIIAAGMIGIVSRWAVWPFALWYSNSHVLTTARLIRREGVFARRGAELALGRLVEVSLTRSVLQRVLGSGRLRLAFSDEAAATGRGVWVLDDVPLVVEVRQIVVSLSAAMPRSAAQRPSGTTDLPGKGTFLAPDPFAQPTRRPATFTDPRVKRHENDSQS